MCRFAAHNIVSSESGIVSQLKKKKKIILSCDTILARNYENFHQE